MTDKIILAITGPTGSGKSTVAEKLAKRIDQCVNIDADHVKHMIVSGFYYDMQPDGTKKWGFNQWGLVGESIGLLARNFLNADYNIIINGYIDEPAWNNLQKHVSLTHKVLLLPRLDAITKRDVGRNEEYRMGAEAVSEHHQHFSRDDFFEGFVKLDTTKHSVDETVDKILGIVMGDRE